MRGSNTLFNDIFTETPVAKPVKGRSADLIEKRNDLVIHRYVFLCEIKPRLSYEQVITMLSDELFLSIVTIPEIISDNRGKIQVLRKQVPTRNYYSKKYPHIVWDVKALLQFN